MHPFKRVANESTRRRKYGRRGFSSRWSKPVRILKAVLAKTPARGDFRSSELDLTPIPKSGRPNILKVNSHCDCARNVVPTTSTPKAAAAEVIVGHQDNDPLDPGPP